ncbi:hypothetical protein CPB83DRAFT_849909 [Crepidotus variabilis]|uniref:Uncharacterized protein n=1 Tax=Crepidotus variabilis TaxID=179855 RepID=A0A9P6JSW4_9AGAR|nr:hypothetical protein CPB83DRAFT_849909 [Crepidotus variabilis]
MAEDRTSSSIDLGARQLVTWLSYRLVVIILLSIRQGVINRNRVIRFRPEQLRRNNDVERTCYGAHDQAMSHTDYMGNETHQAGVHRNVNLNRVLSELSLSNSAANLNRCRESAHD